MSANNLKEWLQSTAPPNVLVLGDVILDRYVRGEVNRISPEAPIQILRSNQTDERPGGAANVVQNLVGMGAETRCLAVVGDDHGGETLRRMFEEQGVSTDELLVSDHRETPVKTRMMARGQQMLRMDREDTHPIRQELQDELLDRFHDVIDWADVVLVCDYRKGNLPPSLLEEVFETARGKDVPVLVDPKGSDYTRYRGTSGIAPNRNEAEQATDVTITKNEDYRRAAVRLLDELDCDLVFITRGSEGMSLFERDEQEVYIPAEEIEVFDVTGAGDTVMAALGLVIGGGGSPHMAGRLANIAGGAAVERLGAAVISREDLLERMEDRDRDDEEKILPLDQLVEALEKHRTDGQTIVFTNGCYDLLHEGHLQTLQFARDQGDCLVVGLNSDESVRQIKGPDRPVKSEETRAKLLASLEMVDYVVLFDDPTPEELIENIVPDVLVKGEDWKGKEVVGQEVVESSDGRVAFSPIVDGISTTSLIEKIRDKQSEEVTES